MVMKKIITLTGLIISLNASAQKDSVNVDSIQTMRVAKEIVDFMFDKITAKNYMMFQQILEAYIKEKQLKWKAKP